MNSGGTFGKNLDPHSKVFIFKSTYHILKERESGGKIKKLNKSLGATEIIFTCFAF